MKRKLIQRSGLWLMLSNGAGRGTAGGCLVPLTVFAIIGYIVGSLLLGNP